MIRGGPVATGAWGLPARWVGMAMMALAGMAAQAEEAAVVTRPTELREGPAASARVLSNLAPAAPVSRLGERQGPWIRVRAADGQAGWVHLFDIGSPASAGGTSAGSALRSVTSLFGKATPQRATTPTSTIGIRGLGAQDLAQAQPDVSAVARMEALRVQEAPARAFARDAALASVAVDPLPAPAAAGSSAPAGSAP